MTGRRLTLLALLLTSMAAVIGLAVGPFRLYFALSCIVSLGVAVPLAVTEKRTPPDRVTYEYDPCLRCSSPNIERASDEIRYIPSPAGDMVRHYVRCSDYGSEFESRVGGGF